MRCDDAATATIALTATPDGAIALSGLGPDRPFGSRDRLLEELPTALNQLAAASTTCLALHSGAVRSPAGEIVLLPATSGSGKTTLTAALVRLGWDYLTDEAAGVRGGHADGGRLPEAPRARRLQPRGAAPASRRRRQRGPHRAAGRRRHVHRRRRPGRPGDPPPLRARGPAPPGAARRRRTR